MAAFRSRKARPTTVVMWDVPQWARAVRAAGGQCQCENPLVTDKPDLASVLRSPCGDHYYRCHTTVSETGPALTVVTAWNGALVVVCDHCRPGWVRADTKQRKAIAQATWPEFD